MDTAIKAAGEGRAFWVAGDHYTIKASGAETGEAFALIEAIVPPGAGPPPHRHTREDEAFYVLEGDFAFEADGRAFAGTTGAWVTLPRGTLHRFHNAGTTPGRMLILVAPAGLEHYFAEVGRPATSTDLAEGRPLPGDIERLLAAAPAYGLEIQAPPH